MPALHPALARVLVALAGILAALPVHADPTIEVPDTGKGTLWRSHDHASSLALVAEIDILAILHADELSTFPEVGDIASIEPDLALAGVGLVGRGSCLSFSLRLDASEILRVRRDDLAERPVAAPIATIDRFLDDAALFYTPRVWASVVAGRFKVPFSRYRQLERGKLTAASVPFLVERLGPDRRWGATLYGDLGSIAYATGAYADFDAMEARPVVAEPVTGGGQALATAYIGWTPRAPIGADHMPTPPSDPWFDTVRLFGGIGVLWRARQGADRVDVSLGGQLKYRRFALMGELFVYSDSGEAGLSGAAQISLLVIDRAVVLGSGEYDLEVEEWAAGGGAGYFITADRRSKVTLVGWLRRGFQGGPRRDGIIVSLQAAL